MFSQAHEVFKKYIVSDNSFGAFYDSSNQQAWLVDVVSIGQSFRTQDLLDSGTREM